MHGTRMGNDCKVYQGAIVGADPQDFRWKGTETFCYVGNEVVIREHVIINRGIYSQGGTRIGDKCFIMAEAHIGHDTHVVGKNVLGNGATVAGDAVIGEGSILSSNAIVNEKVSIGRYALLKGGTRVSSNVPPFVIIAHNPATYYGVYNLTSSQFTERLPLNRMSFIMTMLFPSASFITSIFLSICPPIRQISTNILSYRHKCFHINQKTPPITITYTILHKIPHCHPLTDQVQLPFPDWLHVPSFHFPHR